MVFKRVDFPHPTGPEIIHTEPFGTEKLISAPADEVGISRRRSVTDMAFGGPSVSGPLSCPKISPEKFLLSST